MLHTLFDRELEIFNKRKNSGLITKKKVQKRRNRIRIRLVMMMMMMIMNMVMKIMKIGRFRKEKIH